MKEQDRENSFENLLRRKADEFVPVPSEAVWTGVKNALENQNSKRGFLWLWAAAIGILLGTGVTTLYFLTKSDSGNTVTISDQKAADTIEEQNPLPMVTVPPADARIASIDSAQMMENTSPGETGNPGTVNGSDNKEFRIANQETPIADLPGNNRMNKANLSRVSDHQVLADDPESGQSIAGNQQTARSETVAYDAARADADGGCLLQKLPADPFNALHASDDASMAVAVPGTSTLPMPQPSRFSIAGEVVPLFSWMHYNSRSTGSTPSDQLIADSMSQLQQSSSKPLFGYSAGISGQFMLTEKFALTANVAFTRTGEKNDIMQQGLEQLYADSAGIFNNSGTASATTGSSETKEHYNWLDGNLLAEWFIYNKSRSQLSIHAGLGFSHFMKYTLEVPGYGAESIQNSSFVNNVQQPALFKSYNLTASSGVSYYYRLSDHFRLMGGIQFRYYMTSITLNEVPLTARPYWLGMRTGVVYNF